MSNILLADATGDSSYEIEITNHPLPNSIENKVSLKYLFLNKLYIYFYIQDHAGVCKLTLFNNIVRLSPFLWCLYFDFLRLTMWQKTFLLYFLQYSWHWEWPTWRPVSSHSLFKKEYPR